MISCFPQGTLIRTEAGETPVESLRVGDIVVTASGRKRPLAWIGTGKTLATRGRKGPSTPLIVRKGALAKDVPYRDLCITRGHSLYLDGVLIPVEFLVNHRSIQWNDRAQEVVVFHLELDAHDILLANGAPAESYRDDGNRWMFQNANSGWDRPVMPPCARVLTAGPVVDAVWRRLLDRAGPASPLPLTEDPDTHLVADGVRYDPAFRREADLIFGLPSVPHEVRIGSRAAVPQDLGVARDARCLGLAVRRIIVRQGARFRTAMAYDDRLVDGFYLFERDDNLIWTNGNAGLPPDLFSGFHGPVEVVVSLAGTTRYVDEGRALAAA
jgi:hypothetical protein